MSKPSVLIVGAGAVGLAVGYHLSLAGTDITFLVRPGRKAAFAAPQQLYCYDDAALKTFAGYHVIEHVAELAEKRFHHGGKVHAPDVKALRDCLAEGQRRGQPMAALQALLARQEAHDATSQ